MAERRRSRLVNLALFITLPLLGIAAVLFVILHGVAGLMGGTKLERTVSNSITHSIAQIRATEGDELMLASVEMSENFTYSESVTTPEGTWFIGKRSIPGTTTTADVRVPAVYRFFVRLSEPFDVEIHKRGNARQCVVTAPKLVPQLPVTIDTAGLRVEVREGALRFNEKEVRDEMIRSLTTRLNERASEVTPLARDKARKAFTNFVREWLLRDKLWGRDGVSEIVVRFPDEPVEKTTAGGDY